MVSLKSLAVLALGALPAMAAPASADVASGVAARQTLIEVFACTDKEWRGSCETFKPQSGKCFNVPSSYNDKISSIQNLRPNNYNCAWYQHSGCEGMSYGNQEDANLADGNGWWNDRISSLKCS